MGKSKSTAIAKSDSVHMAEGVEMPGDWLSEILGDDDVDVTGTEEMGQEDVRLPTWLLNSKKEDKETGRACPDDVFWNSLSETGKERLRLVVLANHKSRLWRESNANDELVIRCRSWDGVTGTMEDGTERPCAGCADYQWHRDPETGRRTRRCTDVHNILAMDRETREIGVLKVKKTALRGWKEYYQRYFHKKRQRTITDANGKTRTVIVDVPFFAAETIVEAEKRTGNGYTWYVPRFTFGGALSKEEILSAAEFVKAHLADYLDRAEKTDDDDADEPESSAASTTHDDADFIDAEVGDDFASDEGADRF